MSDFYNKQTREIEGGLHVELEKERNTIENAFDDFQEYVDKNIEGRDWKQSVDVATTSSISDFTSPPSSIDGITLEEGDRVLVKDQSTLSDNGIYRLDSNGELVRTNDFDTGENVDGNVVFVENGTAHAEHRFAVIGTDTTGDDDVVVGDDDISWAKISGTGQISAGSGLTKDSSNNEINVNASDDSINVSADNISVNVDGSTLSKDTSGIYVSNNGITSTQLSDNSVTSSQINSTALGEGLSGGSGTNITVQERFSFETGMESFSTGISNQEENRIVLQTGEVLEVDRIEFRQQGGGSSTSASIDVYDSDNATVVGSANLGSTTLDPGSTGTGNTVLVRVNNSTGSSITATIRVIGRIVS